MIPGMNPRQAKKMMQRMGIQSTEIDATEVIIRTADFDLVFQNPEVSKVNMMGQETFQILGSPERIDKEAQVNITDEDIATVAEQAKVSEDEAKAALEESKGDLAEAILSLTKEE